MTATPTPVAFTTRTTDEVRAPGDNDGDDDAASVMLENDGRLVAREEGGSR